MKIYIDEDFKCHSSNDGYMRGFDLPYFNGKCAEFVAGYRYIPDGERWERPDGVTFRGESLFLWQNYNLLEAVQNAVDRTQGQADEQIMELLDVIEELIIGG